ncbi:MAG: hypothetical protein KKF65_00785 [Nanoarchaeota archaeon]|nr:hypothetical protein [Nanoarchaeota archaeon]
MKMIKSIKKYLSEYLPEELIDDMLLSYLQVKDNFRKEAFAEVIAKSGRYAENVFRILHFLDKNEVLKEVKDMSRIETSIAQNNQLSEPIRLLVPRITRSIIYTIRSKKDSVHVKEKIPDFMDANLNMTAVNWILAELLRELTPDAQLEIPKIIKELMKRNYSLIQTFEGQKTVIADLGAESETLLILFDSLQEGMTRKEIGVTLNNYAASTITNLLKKLVKERKIFLAKSGKFYITNNGEKIISDIIIES